MQFRLGYSPRPLPRLPHSPGLLVLLSIPWGLIILVGAYWGITTNPYGDYFSIQKWGLWDRRNMEFLFLVAMGTALVFSSMVLYHLGEIKGVASMKDKALYREYMIYCRQGIYKRNLQDYTGSVQDFSEAIGVSPNASLTSEAYYFRGCTKEMLKDKRGALEDLSKAGELGKWKGLETHIQRLEKEIQGIQKGD